MNLFINTVSSNSCIILFNEKREILSKDFFEIKGNESSLIIPKIDSFLLKNKLKYSDIKNIVIVNGPGSFTGIRSSVLAINTINYIIGANLTSISFFELYNTFPIIKSSSKKDSFFKKSLSSKIEIKNNIEILNYLESNNIKKVYGDYSMENIEIVEKIDYVSIIKNIKLEKNKIISPLYIKKPNIC